MPLFHATLESNLENILKEGILRPIDFLDNSNQQQNFPNSSPEKVYLMFMAEKPGSVWGSSFLIIDDTWVRENSNYLLGYLSQYKELESEFKEYLTKFGIQYIQDSETETDFAYLQVTSSISIPPNAVYKQK